MHADSLSPLSSSKLTDSSDEFAEVSGKFEHDFMAKLKINDENEEKHEVEEEEEEEDDDQEDDFSFMVVNSDGSTISAEDAFDNGLIRPVFPIFNRDLLFSDDRDSLRPPLKKVFVQQPDDSPSPSPSAAPEGLYCEWTPNTAVKSNSTGFSKRWRFRDLKLRSNSDGKDTFVFLNHPPEKASSSGEKKEVVVKKVKAVKGKTTSSSAHEKHYVMNRAKKESDKRKSYLPYRQELFGFFANANGLSRSHHPY